MRSIERLLVRLPNWLGDVLMARPLLHSLARTWPKAEVRAVAPESATRLLDAESVVARWHVWPRERDARTRLLRELRAWRPEAALVLPPSFSSAWFVRATGAPIRIGYRGDLRTPLLTVALERPRRGDLHLGAEYSRLGRALGATETEAEAPPLAIPTGAVESARRLVERLGIGDRAYAVLGPGAIYGPAKQWPEERFVAVGKRLVADGMRVVVTGTAEEKTLCERVASRVGEAARSAAGETDLVTLSGLVRGARVAVCNDSGLAHLSAAVGTQTVVVFGSTSSSWTAPIGRHVRVVQHAPVCSPCFRRTCRIGYGCLVAVTSDEVADACPRPPVRLAEGAA